MKFELFNRKQNEKKIEKLIDEVKKEDIRKCKGSTIMSLYTAFCVYVGDEQLKAFKEKSDSKRVWVFKGLRPKPKDSAGIPTDSKISGAKSKCDKWRFLVLARLTEFSAEKAGFKKTL